jgi:hypothetical protein
VEEEMRVALIFSLFLAGIGNVPASHRHSPEVEVLINGVPVPRYYHRGTAYVEAIKGEVYAIRITNPIEARVAVALSVDGLNTIDARHTEARSGNKWVLEPYESIVISGWQTSARRARRFFFTTEERSYGAWLGQTENLGIISAVFFRERTHWAQRPRPGPPVVPLPVPGNSQAAPKEQAQADASGAAGLRSQRREIRVAPPVSQAENAATGIGDRIRHEVQWIHMDLEDQPFAAVNLRYEFRPILIKLGVVPPPITNDPLARREKARGFRELIYCPEP